MKNSVTILQTLRSGGKFQQGNSRVGNSLRASFLASVPFCFLRIHPFLSADLLCPLKKVHPQGLSTIWWHWISSVFPWRQFPWHLPRDSGPCLASPAPTPAEFSTSRFLLAPSSDTCRVQHLLFPALLQLHALFPPGACKGPWSGSGSPPQCPDPTGHTGQSLRLVLVPTPFLLNLKLPGDQESALLTSGDRVYSFLSWTCLNRSPGMCSHTKG